MTVDRWEYLLREARAMLWFLVAVVLAGAFGAMLVLARTERCLEAPDIDTARVCWDAATLGWKP